MTPPQEEPNDRGRLGNPSTHQHTWVPLLRLDERGQPVLGSIGSQIGFRCSTCGVEDIKWPHMAGNTAGLTELQVRALNARKAQEHG